MVYVDDCLFFSLDDYKFGDMLSKLRKADLTLEKEDNVAGFLDVHIKVDHTDGSIELTQVGLIDRIVSTMGLTNATEVKTPAECGALQKDEDGENYDTSYNYPSIVGMLLYLQNNARLDITFGVSQCDRYTFCPKLSHEKDLKRIGRYLKGTNTKGLIMKPHPDLNIDCYIDLDLAGLWGYEDSQDPICVRNQTGYTIMIGGYPVLTFK